MVLVYFDLPPFFGKLTMCLVGSASSLVALGYLLRTEVKRVREFYRRMKPVLKKVYSMPLRFTEVDLAEAGVLADTNLVKYSRELEAAGCTHLADVRRELPTSTYNRIFALPAERTFVIFNLMTRTPEFGLFPAKGFYHLLLTWPTAESSALPREAAFANC